MASGTVVMSTQSVDYPGYTRGKYTLTNNIGWNVDNNGNISFSNQGSSDTVGGYWFICSSRAGSGYGVILEPQVNYGYGWVSLTQVFHDVGQCGTSGQVNTIATHNRN